MSVERRLVGEPVIYKGHKIEARHMGPDLLCYVDGTQIGNFYLDRQAAIKEGKRYIDQREQDAKK